jgi:DNA-binding IclR family transcriptional regulator
MAVTPAPAIARMARLLATLGGQPEQWWTLADLTRATGMSKASAHGVLLALVDEGYVRRRDEPVSYALGPALVELGERAKASVDLAGTAEPVLAALSRATDCTAMVGAIRGAEIAVVAATSVPHPFGMTVQVGHRSPFAAPMGTVYAAWSSADAVDRWLDRADPPLSGRQRKELGTVLALVRRRGWSAALRATGTWPTREARDADLVTPDIDVVGIGAPVMGATGRMECSVAIVDLPPHLDVARVRSLAAEVVGGAATLSRALGGNPVNV